MATVKRKGHLNVKRVVITALVFILIIAGIVTLICINKNKKGKNSENTNEPSVNRNDYIKDGEYIKITTDDCSLYVGTTLTLSIEGSDDKVLQSVAFKSSDKDIVSVDEKGNVKAVANGTAVITVTTKDGKHSASCEVTVFIEQQVIDELITKINDELTALKDKKESDYTPESWKEYKKALEAATNAAKDEKATKADLEKVLENSEKST